MLRAYKAYWLACGLVILLCTSAAAQQTTSTVGATQVGSAVVAGTAASQPILLGAEDSSNVMHQLLVNGSGLLETSATASGSFTASPFPDLTAGPTTVTSATTVVTEAITGMSGVGLNVTALGAGDVITAQVSPDAGTTWVAVPVMNVNTFAVTSTITATGAYTILAPSGISNARAQCTTYSTGNVTASIRATVIMDEWDNNNLSQIAGANVNTGHGTAAGSLRVELPTDGTGNVNVNALQTAQGAAIAAVVGPMAQTSTTTSAPTYSTATVNPLSTDTAGNLRTSVLNTPTVEPGNVANTTPWLVTQSPATSGGDTTTKILSAGSTNLTLIKGSGGQVFGYQFGDPNTYAVYFKLYNSATTGAVTVGTTVPTLTIMVPAGGSVAFRCDDGMTGFGSGIVYAITKLSADNDATAVLAGDCVGVVTSK